MFLHIFTHIKAEKTDAQHAGQLFGNLGFAHTGGPDKKKGANRLGRMTQTGKGKFYRIYNSVYGAILAKDDLFHGIVQNGQPLPLILFHIKIRDTCDTRNNGFNVFLGDDLSAVILSTHLIQSARLIYHIDGLVRQKPLSNMTG